MLPAVLIVAIMLGLTGALRKGRIEPGGSTVASRSAERRRTLWVILSGGRRRVFRLFFLCHRADPGQLHQFAP